MAALEAEVLNNQEFTDILDYHFSGNDVTVRNKRTFIEQLRLRAAIYVAAKRTGINKLTAYRWRDSDPEFAAAWEEALDDAADIMETSTYEDALGTEDKPGNALLKMFWLKAHRPKYRDRVSVDVEVVRNEIEERMSQLNLRQLPPAMAQALTLESMNSRQISHPSEDLQKEESGE